MRPAKITPDQVNAALDFYKSCAMMVGDKAELNRLERMEREQERQQEEQGFKSDPDMRGVEDETPVAEEPAPAPTATGFDLQKFMFGGNATFTVVSKGSGTRYTFKVRQPKPDTPHFVKVLTGSDNENDYAFLGTIFDRSTYKHSRKSSISETAPSARAFEWLFKHLADPALESKVDVHHEGRCCRCGRKLTVPSSIESGIGPECAKYFQ